MKLNMKYINEIIPVHHSLFRSSVGFSSNYLPSHSYFDKFWRSPLNLKYTMSIGSATI